MQIPNAATEPRGDACALAGLRVLRAARGLSLNEAAKLAGMSPGYLQKLERCQVQNPSPHKLAKLAEVLHYDYAKLMELAGYPDPSSGTPSDVTPPKYDCITILEEAARSAGIQEEEALMLADTIHELAEAKKTGLDIKRDLLPRVVRSLRELHVQGVESNTLEDALSADEAAERVALRS